MTRRCPAPGHIEPTKSRWRAVFAATQADRSNTIGRRLGRKVLTEVAQIVRPETILAWHRKLVAQKFDGAKNRSTLGRPSTPQPLEELVLQLARDNRTWGYKRIAGALGNLGHKISRATVANILKRHGLAPAPERGKRMLWKDFIQSHLEVLGAWIS